MQHHMANRYQNRAYSAHDDLAHGHPSQEADPLAELARLIGQTDPLANFPHDNPAPVRAAPRVDEHRRNPKVEPDIAHGGDHSRPPPWMLNRNGSQHSDAPHDASLHPVRRYAKAHNLPDPTHGVPRAAHEDTPQAAHDRYEDALYGRPDEGTEYAQDQQFEGAYSDDPYAYQDGYESEVEDYDEQPRRGRLTTVVAILVLGVVGTGAAFAYRTYMGPSHSGPPPIIKADAGPNKIVPPSAENANKQTQDRLAAGTGAEQLVSREEQPVDVKDIARSGPRVVFPPLNQNANPPSTASVAPGNKLPSNAANGVIAGTEPRRIKTVSVRADGADVMASTPTSSTSATNTPAPVPAPPATTRAAPSPSAHGTSGSAPLSLAPQTSGDARTHVASANPAQTAELTHGGYVVQVASRRNEADAKTSFRVLQSKFPSMLGSRAPLIRRADLGSRGVYYRAMVGPFGNSDEAIHFCSNLKAAGGQCVVQRN
jgi:hypothetical protein